MKDRIPTKPGRVKVIREDGTVEHVTLERADEPMEDGTALNKETLLKDETAALYGLDDGAVVDEILWMLGMTRGPTYIFEVYVTLPNGAPATGITVGGLTALTGTGGVKTDSNGYAIGKSSNRTTTLSISSSYVDLNPTSKTVTASGMITTARLAYTTAAGNSKIYTSSFSSTFSPSVKKVTYTIIGGGGAGGSAVLANRGGACGGGGGYAKTGTVDAGANKSVSLTVGAGGSPVTTTYYDEVSTGGRGGTTTLTLFGTTYTAEGGYGGSGVKNGTITSGTSGGGIGGSATTNVSSNNGSQNSLPAAVPYGNGGGGAYTNGEGGTWVGTGNRTAGNATYVPGDKTSSIIGDRGGSHGDGGGASVRGGRSMSTTSGAGHAGAVILSWTY